MNNFDLTYSILLEEFIYEEDLTTRGTEILDYLDQLQDRHFILYFIAQVFDPTGVLSYTDFRRSINAFERDQSGWNAGMVFVSFLASLPGLGMGARLIKDVILLPLRMLGKGSRVARFALSKITGFFSRSSRLKSEMAKVLAKMFEKDNVGRDTKVFYNAMQKLGIRVDKEEIAEAAVKSGVKIDEKYLRKISINPSFISKFMKIAAAKAAGLTKRAARTATAGSTAYTSLSDQAGKNLFDVLKSIPRTRTDAVRGGGINYIGRIGATTPPKF